MSTKYIIDNLSEQTITGNVTINGSLSATTLYGGVSNLPSCKIRIQGTTGLSNTNDGSDFLVLFNNTEYNTSPSTFQITDSKIQLLTSGRYLILGRYSSFDMTDGVDFLRAGPITSSTSSNGDLGTKLEYFDKGYIGTTGNGEASKGGSLLYTASGGEWIGLVALHVGANGGSGTQGFPVFDNSFFNQPYLEIVRIGD